MSEMIADLFDSIAQILVNDAGLKAFCIENFAKAHSVYIGTKPEEEPDPEDYPIVAITSIDKQERGDGNGEDYIDIVVTVAIEKNTVTTSEISGVKIVKHDGLQIAEKLREMVEVAILDSHGLGWKIRNVGRSVLENFYPFFVSTMLIALSRSKLKRQGRGVR